MINRPHRRGGKLDHRTVLCAPINYSMTETVATLRRSCQLMAHVSDATRVDRWLRRLEMERANHLRRNQIGCHGYTNGRYHI